MRSRLRLFALVGILATAVDLGLFLALTGSARGDSSVESLTGATLALLDLIALFAAALVSYALNRTITFRGKPNARWVRSPASFAATATIGGAIDVCCTVVLIALGMDAFGGSGLAAKLVGVGLAMFMRWIAYRWVLFNEVRRDLGLRRARGPAPGVYRLSVVVPAYKAEGEIGATVLALHEYLDPIVGDGQLEVLVVDDGSGDGTGQEATDAGATLVTHQRNRGKGAAVRTGVLAATGQTIVFTDADLSYEPAHVATILHEVEDGWDVVVGSRRHEETTTLVRARAIRELGGRMINWLTHLVLLGHFRDTQCGIKGFRSDIGKVIFERTTIQGFAFDVEVYLIAEQDHLSLKEIPVSVENRQTSSVRIVADTAKLFRDLVRIRRMAGWGRYRPSAAQRAIIDGPDDLGVGLDDAQVLSSSADKHHHEPSDNDAGSVASKRD